VSARTAAASWSPDPAGNPPELPTAERHSRLEVALSLVLCEGGGIQSHYERTEEPYLHPEVVALRRVGWK